MALSAALARNGVALQRAEACEAGAHLLGRLWARIRALDPNQNPDPQKVSRRAPARRFGLGIGIRLGVGLALGLGWHLLGGPCVVGQQRRHLLQVGEEHAPGGKAVTPRAARLLVQG